jgi:tetratricopeptide (TPR) repeat protein
LTGIDWHWLALAGLMGRYQTNDGGTLMLTKTIFATFIATQILLAPTILASPTAQAQALKGASFYLNRGKDRYAQGKWKQAIADYDTALNFEPRNAAIFNARGLAWLEMKDYGLAIRDFNRAIKLAPDLAAAYANRGLARLRQGQESKASQDFNKCLELDESLKAYVEELRSKNAR